MLTHVHRLRSNICSARGIAVSENIWNGEYEAYKSNGLSAFEEELMERCSGDSVT